MVESEVGMTVSSGVLGAIVGVVGMFVRAKYAAKPDPAEKPGDSGRCLAIHGSNEAAHAILFAKVSTLEQKAANTEGKLELIIAGQNATNVKLDRLLERRAD